MAEGGGGGMPRLIKLIIIGIVVLVLLLVGAFLTIKFLSSGDSTAKDAKEAQAMAMPRSSSDHIKTPFYLDLGSFVVNLADGRRYLKTSIQLVINEDKAREYLNVRVAEVKDLVVAELQVLSSDQLRDPNERELLKQRLLKRVETLLPVKDKEWEDPMPLKKVLITEFYLQ
ncbi:MAG: flagellar basal body-associated FliL family protein [Deltaproteobacteria bacterium]|nr:flagellar basal body-associated FliL family protein [Deltaproteobacteria bacterium]